MFQFLTSPRVLAVVGVAGLVALSACGSESSASDGSDEVASLIADDEVASADDGVDTGTASADEAALAFSQCLRDEGLDVPDIGVDAEGNIELFQLAEVLEPGQDGLQEAFEACAELLEGVGFGGGGGALDDVEVQDAFVEFSECVRAEGFGDIPDLSLSFGGNGDGPPEGGPPAGGEGEGGFGDRESLLAQQLGLDPDDPEVIAAMEACIPIIDTALAGGPLGGGEG